jgi:hypothetical protein
MDRDHFIITVYCLVCEQSDQGKLPDAAGWIRPSIDG